MLATLGCTADPDVSEPTWEPRVDVERSPDETEPADPPPSIEQTGAPVAALHARAMREPDPEVAAQLFEQACDRAFAPSCIALADRLEGGEGVEPDPSRARGLLEQACMEGSTIACDRLGH